MAKGTFGERLKRERELREVSFNEVTAATRIGPRFLEALENEDWEKLPGGAFNRGFVRSIARYLGLNEESFLAEYDLAIADGKNGKKGAAPAPENRIPSPPKWKLAVAAFVLLAVVAGIIAAGMYGWRQYSLHHHAKHSLRGVSAPLFRS